MKLLPVEEIIPQYSMNAYITFQPARADGTKVHSLALMQLKNEGLGTLQGKIPGKWAVAGLTAAPSN